VPSIEVEVIALSPPAEADAEAPAKVPSIFKFATIGPFVPVLWYGLNSRCKSSVRSHPVIEI
jgi:hypothetical protein